MGKRELIALLKLSSWCLVMVEWLFLAVQWVSLQFVIGAFPDHPDFLFLIVKDHFVLGGSTEQFGTHGKLSWGARCHGLVCSL